MDHRLVFALIPFALSIGITPALPFDFTQDAFALKAAGKSSSQYGSAGSPVCGDRICSEIQEESLYVSLYYTINELERQELGTINIESPASNLGPLSSWNEGNSKEKIIEFVDKVTNPSSSAFVTVESSHAEKSEEIAVMSQWLLEQAIDVDEAVKEILAKRNK